VVCAFERLVSGDEGVAYFVFKPRYDIADYEAIDVRLRRQKGERNL